MPTGQPFTRLCQQLARPRHADRADLHLHTTYSDGTYTPGQVVELAQRSGLCAIAITDHDTVGGIEEARRAATSLEVIAGVEITAEYRGRELHLLGYLFRPDDRPLCQALDQLCGARRDRFREMVNRLRELGVMLPEEACTNSNAAGALGRRNLAELLVRFGKAANVREAFHRYLADGRPADVPKQRLPVSDAIRLVADAGGIAAWAHPTYDCTREALAELRCFGMKAIEVDYPSAKTTRSQELRHWAGQLGMAVTGGSDCHGPDQAGHAPGACGVSRTELEYLRESATL